MVETAILVFRPITASLANLLEARDPWKIVENELDVLGHENANTQEMYLSVQADSMESTGVYAIWRSPPLIKWF